MLKIESETVDVMTFVISLSRNWQRRDIKFKLKDVYNTLRKLSVSIHINLNVTGHLVNALLAQGGSWTHSSAARFFFEPIT